MSICMVGTDLKLNSIKEQKKEFEPQYFQALEECFHVYQGEGNQILVHAWNKLLSKVHHHLI